MTATNKCTKLLRQCGCGATNDDVTPHPLPVNGLLDLHTVDPKDVHWLVPDYIGACRAQGILDVRIIHGKGIMALQRTVHALLAHDQNVASFKLADESSGGWGATVARLKATGREIGVQ